MSTKQSAISAFLGEAAPAEASVKIEITGTPQSVQRAVAKMAKKPGAGKKPSLPKEEKPATEPEAPKPEAEEHDLEDKAADVVESLIKEDDTEEDKLDEFTQYLKNCSDKQVQGVYDKEKKAGRRAEMRLAKAEAERRGIDLDL